MRPSSAPHAPATSFLCAAVTLSCPRRRPIMNRPETRPPHLGEQSILPDRLSRTGLISGSTIIVSSTPKSFAIPVPDIRQ
jgi:hypothetical protein